MLEEYCLWHHAAFLRRRTPEVPRADVPSEDPPRPDEPCPDELAADAAVGAMPVELLVHVPTVTDAAPAPGAPQ